MASLSSNKSLNHNENVTKVIWFTYLGKKKENVL
jgi:hypothetical protein